MDEEEVLPVNTIPRRSDFLAGLGIKPGGLGAQLFSGIYDGIFVSSIDLRDQYTRYYCVEYPSFQIYLECAHEIYLDLEELEKQHILKFKSSMQLISRHYDDNVFDKVMECVRKLETAHEN
ncbi:hypothetical protein N2597_29070 (plasmid) [Rhizobium sophoriradicis]|uniref:hypothetical protein n=1 Tax=Rhizobium sophoriradicis TaxID=1535245 RepID=UPI001618E6B5|nr:hypothetical protein N2597_29070 [Rhizobium leguminosarum bv. phaseoli]